MKFFFTLFLVASFNSSTSQTIVIVDLISKNPVPFTNAIFLKKDNTILGGDYADEKGFIILNENSISDKIKFSCIGFEDLIIERKAVIDTVFVKKSIIALDEVAISKASHILKELGFIESRKKIDLGISKGIETVVFIENNSEIELSIKSFLFKIQKTLEKVVIRVHFYKLNPNKFEPYTEILSQDIIYFLDKNTKGTVEVDVRKYNLKLPAEGGFVGLENLGDIYEHDQKIFSHNNDSSDILRFALNYEINKSITFMRNRFEHSSWDNTETLKTQLIQIKSQNFPNASFGIKVFD